MLKVGLTGGMGSGKSLVASVFTILGIPVYHADEAAKCIMNTHAELRNSLIEAFGPKVYSQDKIDRALLAEIIFRQDKNLQLANSIIHPFVLKDFIEWTGRFQDQDYVLMEAAILFESHADKLMDKVIVVTSPYELRIERIMKRDNCSRENVTGRMRHQLSEEDRVNRAGIILYNDNSHLIISQVLDIHDKIKKSLINKNK